MAMNQKINNPKENNGQKKKNNKEEKGEYEFCKVCNFNHDQGNRHKYFPNHKKYLSSFLSRFRSRLADVRFFLKNPSPDLASRNRLWCVFCEVDVDDTGSSFACANAIHHLASAEHLKNLKHFLWKYGGGGTDRIDTFCVSESDLSKWEQKCKSLKSEDALCNGGPEGLQVGPLNDIRNELNNEFITNSRNNTSDPCKSNVMNSVTPLQYYTNEYQISQSGLPAVANFGTSLPLETSFHAILWNSHDLTGNSHHSLHYGTAVGLSNFNNRGVLQCGGMPMGTSYLKGSQSMTKISAVTPDKSGGNLHTGAPPPWLEACEESQLNAQPKHVSSSFVSLSNKPGKPNKLNPKRVGAAWAERRKLELEMEKRGEIVKRDCDADWLPNFGRVWQSGSRKESRKEFEKEKQKLPKVENSSEMPITIQPYISKRMRKDTGGG